MSFPFSLLNVCFELFPTSQGWGDPINIESSDVAEGLKLAERSCELVKELCRGEKQLGRALWLVGALQLAAGRWREALSMFLSAEEAFRAAAVPACATMARGYSALARKLEPGSLLEGSESLAGILLSLRAMESDEARFFADQLVTATRSFLPEAVLHNAARSE